MKLHPHIVSSHQVRDNTAAQMKPGKAPCLSDVADGTGEWQTSLFVSAASENCNVVFGNLGLFLISQQTAPQLFQIMIIIHKSKDLSVQEELDDRFCLTIFPLESNFFFYRKQHFNGFNMKFTRKKRRQI